MRLLATQRTAFTNVIRVFMNTRMKTNWTKTGTTIARMAAAICVGLALASWMSRPSAAQTTSVAQTAEAPTRAATLTPFAVQTAIADQRAPGTPRDAAVVPRTLYVANGGGTLATFAIDSNGAPVLLDTVGNLGTSLRGLVVAPDGRSAYVLDSAASTVSAFALDGAGRPTLIGTALPTDPNGVVSSACAADGTLPGPCPTAAATASSDADGRVARYDWDFGDGQRAMDAGPCRPKRMLRRVRIRRP
jgi:hypothetical protein